ncbi:MAG: glutaredoxin domain-containing protein [Bacteriovoracaceae bacterium]
MKEITIYSLVHCPYCVRAKDLLSRNNIPFKEVIADELPRPEIDKLFTRSGMRTFPQIFATNDLIGGYSELKELDDTIGLKAYLE